jgi:hypothetical protein
LSEENSNYTKKSGLMKKVNLLSIVFGILLSSSCQGKTQQQVVNEANVQVQPQQLHVYKNLSIYLIQGKDQVDRKYVTLEEAMDKKLIVLHETGNVDELSVDNKSDRHVFILSGDIVKGGRQDRTMAEDVILKPGSKNVPLKSFCVEHGRWTQRESENAAAFSSSKNMLSNKNMKIAARAKKEQQEVWKEVSSFQDEASKNVNADVKSNVSASSLQLTLENKDLQSVVNEYMKALEPFFKEKSDVLGFVFCINGKISTVDIFGNADLFRKLRTKLLESAANEAVFQYDEKLRFEHPSVKTINTFIADAEKGEETVTNTGENTIEKRYETDKSVMFKTYNTDAGKEAVHTTVYSTEGVDMGSSSDQQFRYGGINRNRR